MMFVSKPLGDKELRTLFSESALRTKIHQRIGKNVGVSLFRHTQDENNFFI